MSLSVIRLVGWHAGLLLIGHGLHAQDDAPQNVSRAKICAQTLALFLFAPAQPLAVSEATKARSRSRTYARDHG